jgi:hypothetical protein
MEYPKMTVFNKSHIERCNNMASVRNYKMNGLFNNKVLTTCPAYPRYHASHGEPVTNLPVFEE